MNPILRFLRAFLTYSLCVAGLVLARQDGWTLLVYVLGVASMVALAWCVVCVFKAVDYEPE